MSDTEVRSPIHLSNYWFNRAQSLHKSALILYRQDKGGSVPLYDPCLLLAGLSLEVITKAILVKKHQKFDEKRFSHHRIREMVSNAEIILQKEQKDTLLAFEESILWLSKYPEPKSNNTNRDVTRVLFKDVGEPIEFGQVITADSEKWPSEENYLSLWEFLLNKYVSLPTNRPGEIGYRLKGHD